MSKLVKFAKSVSPSTGHNHQLNENEESKVKSSDPSSQKKQNPRKASGKEKKDLIWWNDMFRQRPGWLPYSTDIYVYDLAFAFVSVSWQIQNEKYEKDSR